MNLRVDLPEATDCWFPPSDPAQELFLVPARSESEGAYLYPAEAGPGYLEPREESRWGGLYTH